MSSCATLEYLAGLYRGNVRDPVGLPDLYKYTNRFMSQPEYSNEVIRLLFCMFRHKIAHHGIATGVWIDHKLNRRVSWTVSESELAPVIEVTDAPPGSKLINDSPWPCDFTHRAEIRIGRLAAGIVKSALDPDGYLEAVKLNDQLLHNFKHCMDDFYPA